MAKASLTAIVLAFLVAGCGPEKRTVGLDVDVYLHPGSSDLADVLLQTGISRRLEQDPETKDGIIHVRVVNGLVVLSGAVGSEAAKQKAESIALSTVVRVNDEPIQARMPVSNRIDVQR